MRSRTTDRSVVLLVDDDGDDVQAVRDVLDTNSPQIDLRVVETGEAALTTLRNRDESGPTIYPELVVVDPSLPDVDSEAFLETLTTDPDLPRVPVIVLSRAVDDEATIACYRRYANAVVRKPDDADGFVETVGSLGRFWLSVAQLPEHVA